jgi:hypothetical protein
VSRRPEGAALIGWWRRSGPPVVCRPHQGGPAAVFSAETGAAGMAVVAAITRRVIN